MWPYNLGWFLMGAGFAFAVVAFGAIVGARLAKKDSRNRKLDIFSQKYVRRTLGVLIDGVPVEGRQVGNDYDDDCEIVKWSGGRLPEHGRETSWLFEVPVYNGNGQWQSVFAGDWVVKFPDGRFRVFSQEMFHRVTRITGN